MSQMMKAFMGVFIVMFLMTSATGILGAFYQILHAQNTHAAIIDELENSDYAKNVMKECFDVAQKENYRLQLTLYSSENKSIICTSAEDVPDDTGGITMVEVVLFYDIEIAFFKISEEQELFGYAR